MRFAFPPYGILLQIGVKCVHKSASRGEGIYICFQLVIFHPLLVTLTGKEKIGVFMLQQNKEGDKINIIRPYELVALVTTTGLS
jgi:hypothetical protein